ncbi:hypothetical protein ACH5RR_000912 [Cinchona calisaya]|uniref:Uncharacterized protein n=1 Tax=Cinchona calisaya TaxID=153742 RepID=A0ABD3B2G1_9GENT
MKERDGLRALSRKCEAKGGDGWKSIVAELDDALDAARLHDGGSMVWVNVAYPTRVVLPGSIIDKFGSLRACAKGTRGNVNRGTMDIPKLEALKNPWYTTMGGEFEIEILGQLETLCKCISMIGQ